MQILALDTASPVPSVTLLTPGAVWEEFLSPDRRASEELLPSIERCFSTAKARLGDCDRIAVCSGPGSFTGLRIGLATAWGLGRATGIPVETVSTLEALAEAARPSASDRGSFRVAAVLDAGRGEVVLAVFDLEEDRARLVSAPVRLSVGAARERVQRMDRTIALPPNLLDPAVPAGPGLSPSRALALAVMRRPGEPLARLQGIYSRPSAAEEKHGAS